MPTLALVAVPPGRYADGYFIDKSGDYDFKDVLLGSSRQPMSGGEGRNGKGYVLLDPEDRFHKQVRIRNFETFVKDQPAGGNVAGIRLQGSFDAEILDAVVTNKCNGMMIGDGAGRSVNSTCAARRFRILGTGGDWGRTHGCYTNEIAHMLFEDGVTEGLINASNGLKSRAARTTYRRHRHLGGGVGNRPVDVPNGGVLRFEDWNVFVKDDTDDHDAFIAFATEIDLGVDPLRRWTENTISFVGGSHVFINRGTSPTRFIVLPSLLSLSYPSLIESTARVVLVGNITVNTAIKFPIVRHATIADAVAAGDLQPGWDAYPKPVEPAPPPPIPPTPPAETYADIPAGYWKTDGERYDALVAPYLSSIEGNDPWRSETHEWNTRVYVPALNAALAVAQGGHNGSGSTAVTVTEYGAGPSKIRHWIFRTHTPLLGWEAYKEPSVAMPRSHHGAGGHCLVESIKAIFVCGYAPYPLNQLVAAGINNIHMYWLYFYEENRFEKIAAPPWVDEPDHYDCVAYDPERDVVYNLRATWREFDVKTRTWRNYGRLSAYGGPGVLVYIPPHLTAVRFHNQEHAIEVVDVFNPASPKLRGVTAAGLKGDKLPSGSFQTWGWAYCPDADLIVGWGGGREVATFDWRTDTLRVIPNGDGDAPDEATHGNGVYGNWHRIGPKLFAGRCTYNGRSSVYRLA